MSQALLTMLTRYRPMQFQFKSVLDDAHEDGEEGGTLGLIFQGNVARKALSTRWQHSFQYRFFPVQCITFKAKRNVLEGKDSYWTHPGNFFNKQW